MLLTTMLAVAAAGAQQMAAPALRDDQPIDVSANRCEVFDNQDTVQCTGQVRVRQGEAILSAERMTIYGTQAEGGFERIEAEGSVRYAADGSAMSGREAIYDASATTLTVTGDVVVVQDQQVMTGGKLVYNTSTGATVFMPDGTGRVRGVFYPSREGS